MILGIISLLYPDLPIPKIVIFQKASLLAAIPGSSQCESFPSLFALLNVDHNTSHRCCFVPRRPAATQEDGIGTDWQRQRLAHAHACRLMTMGTPMGPCANSDDDDDATWDYDE